MSHPVGRREFLRAAGLTGGLFLLNACAPATQPAATAAPKPASASAPAPAATTAPAAKTSKSLAPIRLGYQTNIWGMPVLVGLQSKAFESRSLSIAETRVDSGNRTRDLMVAGQLDMGTYSAPTLIIGAEKADLVAVSLVALGAGTADVVGNKAKGISSLADLKGKKIAVQQGSSTGNVMVTKILPDAGLKQGDYQLVSMSLNDMPSALGQGAIDAMQNQEPFNAIVVAKGLGTRLAQYEKYDSLPIFIVVRGDFLEKNTDTVVEYLKGMEVTAKMFKDEPDKAYGIIYDFYKQSGLELDQAITKDAASRLKVQTDYPADVKQYMQETADWQKGDGQIKEIPSWDKVIRTDLRDRARKELAG